MYNLSVVIPTKNRHFTALYAVKSVIDLGDSSTEVIVQDCSDTDSLKTMLFDTFGADSRIKYHYIDHPISMTDNWNSAFLKASGKYVCGIGDDDAVMPSIVDVVNWMESVDADAVLPLRISYVWEDAYVGQISCGRVTFPSKFTGCSNQIDLERELKQKTKDCGFGYDVNLPNLYHGIIRNDILLQHKACVGAILRGTSLDAYASFAFAKYVKKAYYVDYPITIRGICGSSNANRNVSKKIYSHFKEFDSKSLSIPEYLPQILNSDVSITESCIIALQDINRHDLIANLDLSVIYGKCAANDPTLFLSLYIRLLKYKTTGTNSFRYFRIFLSYYFGRTLKHGMATTILYFLNKMYPIYDLLCDRLIKKSRKIKAIDITAAIDIVDKFVRENGIALQLNKII